LIRRLVIKCKKAAELVTPVRTMGEYHRQGV
jgi:hypothetical protein